MAGGMDLGTSSKGGKKALDAAINLVPFIDLMAVTISFLIMTAVWTQIGRLQVSSSGASSGAEPDKELNLPLTLLITERELKLTIGGSVSEPMPFVHDATGRLDLHKLKEKIAEVHNTFPAQQSITLQTEDAVNYDDLVKISLSHRTETGPFAQRPVIVAATDAVRRSVSTNSCAVIGSRFDNGRSRVTISIRSASRRSTQI